MLVPGLMNNRRNLTSLFFQPPLLVHSLKQWNLEGFAVNTRPTRFLRRSMLRPSRKKLAKLLSSRKSWTLMFWFMESLRGMIWLSTLGSNFLGLPLLPMDGFNLMDLAV
nr:uncharacterized protein LOC108844722 [Ipomoea batatas]